MMLHLVGARATLLPVLSSYCRACVVNKHGRQQGAKRERHAKFNLCRVSLALDLFHKCQGTKSKPPSELLLECSQGSENELLVCFLLSGTGTKHTTSSRMETINLG